MDDLIRSAMQRAFRVDNSAIAAEVLAVDDSVMQCRVRLVENPDLVLEGVRLRAVDDAQDQGFVLLPKVGSSVLVAQIRNTSAYYVAMFSEVDAARVLLSGGKLRVEKGGESLGKVLDDLISAILALTVTTSVGPSGTPINFLDFQNVAIRLKTILDAE